MRFRLAVAGGRGITSLMTQDHAYPLAAFHGARPPAPAWYDAAVAVTPERGRIAVECASIEWRAWGPAGAPGLLLVHGGWAHAGWWSHLAPLLAQGRRVAALTLSGMGGSDWRKRYSIEQYARELHAIAGSSGLLAGGPPVIVGHSFGCAPTVTAASDPADWTAGAILLDGSISMKPGDMPPPIGRKGRAFSSVEAALARYRLLPAQPCENLFLLDAIARESLRPSPEGLVWSFDPGLYERCRLIDSRAAAKRITRPLAIVRGARSEIVTTKRLADLRGDLPGARFVTIPESGHHVMLDQPLALVAALEKLLADWFAPTR